MIGCAISPYSETAYQNATSLKVDSLNLVDKAVEDYSAHQSEVADLSTKLQKAYEYAKGLPNNEIVTQQWQIMLAPDRHLLGGLLKEWKEQSKLSSVFVTEEKGQISDGFDQIIGLESGKVKPSDVK
jgi:hypothetical protein